MNDVIPIRRPDEREVRRAVEAASAKRLKRNEERRSQLMERMVSKVDEANASFLLRRSLIADLVMLWAQKPARWRLFAHRRWSQRLAKAMNALTWHMLSEVPS